MTRPLRLDFPGALHHVTSRGDRREDIYLNNDDRRDWLDVLGNTERERASVGSGLTFKHQKANELVGFPSRNFIVNA